MWKSLVKTPTPHCGLIFSSNPSDHGIANVFPDNARIWPQYIYQDSKLLVSFTYTKLAQTGIWAV